MKLRLILLCALVVAGATSARCEQAENAQAVMRSSAFAAGTAMESAAATQDASLGEVASTGQSASHLAEFFGGFLTPAIDSGGAITAQRIIDFLLLRDVTLDPLSADFFGNQDGKLDVADTVTFVNEQQ